MRGQKKRLTPEQVKMLREWWAYRKVSNKVMCHRLGIHRCTMLNAVRGEGAYRG